MNLDYVVKDGNGNIVFGPVDAEYAMRYGAALNRVYRTDDYRVARYEPKGELTA
jgi:hypothetical protein